MSTALLPDLVKLLDWVGTLAFAFSGGLLGARKGFDLFGAGACIFLRLMAIYRGWRVPVAHHRIDPGNPGGR